MESFQEFRILVAHVCHCYQNRPVSTIDKTLLTRGVTYKRHFVYVKQKVPKSRIFSLIICFEVITLSCFDVWTIHVLLEFPHITIIASVLIKFNCLFVTYIGLRFKYAKVFTTQLYWDKL